MGRRLVSLVAALALLAGPTAWAPAAVARQAPAPTIELFRSADFGFVVWWDAAVWTVAEQTEEAGYAFLRLESDLGVAFYEALAGPDADVGGCLTRTAEDRLADAAVSDLTLEWTDYGWASEWSATARFRFAYAGADGPLAVLEETDCQVIRAGESVLRRTALAATAPDARPDATAATLQADRVVFLRETWPPPVQSGLDETRWAALPVILGQRRLVDPAAMIAPEAPAPTVSLVLFEQADDLAVDQPAPPPGHHYARLTATFANDVPDGEPIVAAPERFYLEDTASTRFPPTDWTWERGAADPKAAAVELAPAAAARLVVWFVVPDDTAIERVACFCGDRFVPRPLTSGDAIEFDLADTDPYPAWTYGRAAFVVLPDRSGRERAALTNLASGTDGTSQWLMVFVENSGDASLEIDPARFAVELAAGSSLAPIASHRWLVAPGGADAGPQTLLPGDVAVIRIDLPPSPDSFLQVPVFYLPDPDRPVRVAGW